MAATVQQDLSADLSALLGDLVATFRHAAPADGLSLTAVGTLSTLIRTGPQRLGDLAAGERVSQPAMTQLVTRLETAGLVERRGAPGDGRVVLVAITDDGRDRYARRRDARAERIAERLAAAADPDRAAIAAALPALRRLLAAGPVQQP